MGTDIIYCHISSPSSLSAGCIRIWTLRTAKTGLSGGPVVKNLPANAGDTGSIPGLERFHRLWSNKAHVPHLLRHSQKLNKERNTNFLKPPESRRTVLQGFSEQCSRTPWRAPYSTDCWPHPEFLTLEVWLEPKNWHC